ncbi:MAG: CDP-alcohol phosphatidyltransferase family protein [Gammaproteobacteria bacterium]|nr:CDP-alcohol phosphatidyltransferase family protein [Gammaproteobacteria bacterium]
MYDKDVLRQYWSKGVEPLFGVCTRFGIKPIQITLMGCVFIAFACFQLIIGNHWVAVFGFFMAGFCDSTDGAYARATNQVTVSGGFIDSVVDRYNEFIIVGTVLYLYRDQPVLYYWSFVVFLGISLMSYTRALYGKYGFQCPGNPFEYLERGLLLLVFIVFERTDLWLITIAIGTHVFVMLRIVRFFRLSAENA